MPGNHYGWEKKFAKFNIEDNNIAVVVADQKAIGGDGGTIYVYDGNGPMETGPGDLIFDASGGDAENSINNVAADDSLVVVVDDVNVDL